jgi:hypothetical protein
MLTSPSSTSSHSVTLTTAVILVLLVSPVAPRSWNGVTRISTYVILHGLVRPTSSNELICHHRGSVRSVSPLYACPAPSLRPRETYRLQYSTYTQMRSLKCLVYFRFPEPHSSSSIQIARRESIAHYRSTKIPLIPFKHYVDVLGGGCPECPVARVRVPLLFWFYFLLRQTDSALYVVERQHRITP